MPAPIHPAPQPPQDSPPGDVSGRAARLIELSGRIRRTIGIARALVDGGRALDLTGIDDGIGILCAQTLDLAPDEARVLVPYLGALLEQADSLAASLRQQHRAGC